MKNLIVIMVIMALTVPSYAGSSGGAAEWLRYGVGARAKGMGQAFVAVANDPTAAYYNPSGLSQLRNKEFMFMMSNVSLDRKVNYLSYSHPLKEKSRSISVSWLGLGIDSIDERDQFGNKDGSFDFVNNAFQLSFSQEVFQHLYGGISVKYIESKFDGLTNVSNGSSDGYGIDLGLMYKISDRYVLGLAVQDIASKLDWQTGRQEDVPRVFRMGASGKFFNDKLLLSGEMDNESYSKDTRLYFGAEYTFIDKISVRAGSRDSYFTGGLSYRQPYDHMVIKLDYAFLQDAFSTDYSQSESHLFSLGLSF